jgi:hypothetical protein
VVTLSPRGQKPVDVAVARWAKKLRVPLTNSVEGVFELGDSLIACRPAVGHGKVLDVLGQVGVEPRVASRYAKVARNPVLANRTYWSHLPAVYSTLYVGLTSQPDEFGAGRPGSGPARDDGGADGEHSRRAVVSQLL